MEVEVRVFRFHLGKLLQYRFPSGGCEFVDGCDGARVADAGDGDAAMADVVRVEWPSGVIDELRDVASNQIWEVTESPKPKIQSAIVLSWPVTEEDFVVEGADSLEGPWNVLELPIMEEDEEVKMVVLANDRMEYYRLRMVAVEPL